MTERGLFQRALDGVAEYTRDHGGTLASGTAFLASSGAAAARIEAAPIGIALSAIALGISSGADYMNNIIGRNWPSEETTIMTAEELQSALAASAEEGPSAA